MHPPKELFVQVRVIKEFGEFTLESGESVMLTLGTQVRMHILLYVTWGLYVRYLLSSHISYSSFLFHIHLHIRQFIWIHSHI